MLIHEPKPKDGKERNCSAFTFFDIVAGA